VRSSWNGEENMNKKSKDSKSGSTINIDRREFIISVVALAAASMLPSIRVRGIV
jgi:hypothetical protein